MTTTLREYLDAVEDLREVEKALSDLDAWRKPGQFRVDVRLYQGPALHGSAQDALEGAVASVLTDRASEALSMGLVRMRENVARMAKEVRDEARAVLAAIEVAAKVAP